jgi:hypothetical protein
MRIVLKYLGNLLPFHIKYCDNIVYNTEWQCSMEWQLIKIL